MRIFRRFNNLPIEKKLLLVSVIPILTLAVLSIITFNSVQTFSRMKTASTKCITCKPLPPTTCG